MAAVPYGLQDSHEEVIHNKRQRAGKIDSEICDGVGQDGGRRPHPHQNLGGGKYPCKGQQAAADESEGDGCMDGFLKAKDVLRTEIAGDYDARTNGDSVEESYHQKNQAAGGTDSRKGCIAEKVADNDRICRIIKLLKKISPKKRKRKCDNALPDCPFCHKGG